MARSRKKAGKRHGLQVVTLCISTTMVLVLLGLVVFSVLTANNLSNYVKENLTVTVLLDDAMGVNDAHRLCKDLYHRPYTRHIDYISKDQAKREQCEAMGSDPTEFLGFNPFSASLEIRLKSDYANGQSLGWISREIEKRPGVTSVTYQEDLMDKVNSNIRKLGGALLALAVLLTCVSFSLINNSVRLSVYSRRFIIHTMKLVGASWGFIRRPFLRRAIGIGIVAALLACIVLGCGFYALCNYEPGMLSIITWKELAVTGAAVFLFGIVITALCSFFSVNRFLRMTAGELYKI